MSRKKYFFLGVIIITGLSTLDLIFTWILTPDLANEANPLVEWYGVGWVGIIFISLALICFVIIPFYYHCLVFNYPVSKSENNSPIKLIGTYLFHNHKNPYISVGKALFNGLGFYLFWWIVINKTTAIYHNLLLLKQNRDSEISFSERMKILDHIDNIFLISIMIFFIVGIVYKTKNASKRKRNTNSLHFSIVTIFFLLYLSFKLFTYFAKTVHSVQLTNKTDPDIVLVNIGKGDRASIGNLLLTIDSCKPTLVGIDVLFIGEKNPAQDSVLMEALKSVKNEILGYAFDSSGKPSKSPEKFGKYASEEGLLTKGRINGLVSSITPVQVFDNAIHELFALKVISLWKPDFKHNIKIGESISIQFTRTLTQFVRFDGLELRDKNVCEYLRNKVVLLGYLGPDDEDKYFTPIRLVKEYPDNLPDTYGLVIVANEIRTILEHRKQD